MFPALSETLKFMYFVYLSAWEAIQEQTIHQQNSHKILTLQSVSYI